MPISSTFFLPYARIEQRKSKVLLLGFVFLWVEEFLAQIILLYQYEMLVSDRLVVSYLREPVTVKKLP